MNRTATEALVLIAASIVLTAIGQLLLKNGMNRVGNVEFASMGGLLETGRTIATTWQVLVGLVMYVIAFVLWLAVLSKVDLAYAYPVFVMVNFVVVLLIAWIFLKEPFPPLRFGGVLVSLAGVAIVALSYR